jgi:hypothetical protein
MGSKQCDFNKQKEAHLVESIKKLVWLYFWLIILEGALRKWILPQFATPILVIRDPIIILIYILSLRARIFPMTFGLITILLMAGVFFIVGYAAENNTIYIALYGLRTDFLHFPLIFLLPKIFTQEDVFKMGKTIILLCFPMAILMAFQFLSPPNAWINAAVGEGAEQIRATVNNIRPPGTFSFITGAAEYLALCAAFLLFAYFDGKTYSQTIIVIGSVSLLFAIMMSISRLALTYVGLVYACTLFALLIRPAILSRHLILVPAFLFAIVSALQLDIVQNAFLTFGDRISEATNSEGGWHGYIDRILGTMLNAYDPVEEIPWLGRGLGIGTSAGAKLLTGVRGSILAEGEWERVVQESGTLLGTLFLFWRIWLIMHLFKRALNSALAGRLLPLTLWGATAPLILVGQIGRPTTLGFTVFSAALCLASAIPEGPSKKYY